MITNIKEWLSAATLKQSVLLRKVVNCGCNWRLKKFYHAPADVFLKMKLQKMF